MRKLFLPILLISLLASCEKKRCYQCETYYKTGLRTQHQICDANEADKERYENANTDYYLGISTGCY